MLVVSSGALGSSAAQVLGHVRRGGVVLREELVAATGLSPATVSRTIAGLTDAGLIRSRADLGRAGVIGRPSIPIQLATDRHAVIGVHLGRLWTTVCLADLRGRVLATSEHRRPDSHTDVIELVRADVEQLRTGARGRLVLSAGVVAPWADLDVGREQTGERLTDALGVAVATADHISAAAAAEHTAGLHGVGGDTVYVYVRDTIGFAVATDDGERTSVSRASRLTHFPAGSSYVCRCRTVGCLEATASDEALGRRAHGEGISDTPDISGLITAASEGSRRADEMLRERAAVLGRAAAFVRDMVQPDHLVLVGQGFTRYRPAAGDVVAAFEAASTLPVMPVSFGAYGADLQAVAASTVALGPVYADPLGPRSGTAP